MNYATRVVEEIPDHGSASFELYAPVIKQRSFWQYFEDSWFAPKAISNEIAMKPSENIVAFHPHKEVMAINRGSSISLFQISQKLWLDPIKHHSVLGNGIFCMSWTSESDTLLVGANGGVACWRIIALSNNSCDESLLQFLEHPSGKAVHFLSPCPTGRMFAAATMGESCIYIWDLGMAVHVPVYCINESVARGISWSPNGLHIAVNAGSGCVTFLDTYAWQHDNSFQTKPYTPSQLCWLRGGDGLFFAMNSLLIYKCEVEERRPSSDYKQGHQARAQAQAETPNMACSALPIALDVSNIAANDDRELVIADMTSEETLGHYLAVTFRYKICDATSTATAADQESEHPVLPFVAIYQVSSSPALRLLLVRVIESSETILAVSNVLQSYSSGSGCAAVNGSVVRPRHLAFRTQKASSSSSCAFMNNNYMPGAVTHTQPHSPLPLPLSSSLGASLSRSAFSNSRLAALDEWVVVDRPPSSLANQLTVLPPRAALTHGSASVEHRHSDSLIVHIGISWSNNTITIDKL